MTLRPEQIGDKGQRWIIKACGYPKPGWNVIGYAKDHDGAVTMADAIAKAPGCTSTHCRDRKVKP